MHQITQPQGTLWSANPKALLCQGNHCNYNSGWCDKLQLQFLSFLKHFSTPPASSQFLSNRVWRKYLEWNSSKKHLCLWTLMCLALQVTKDEIFGKTALRAFVFILKNEDNKNKFLRRLL